MWIERWLTPMAQQATQHSQELQRLTAQYRCQLMALLAHWAGDSVRYDRIVGVVLGISALAETLRRCSHLSWRRIIGYSLWRFGGNKRYGTDKQRNCTGIRAGDSSG